MVALEGRWRTTRFRTGELGGSAAGNALLYFLANSPTTATLSVPATAGTTDVIDFTCTAF